MPRKRNGRAPAAGTRRTRRRDALALLHAGHQHIVALFGRLTRDGMAHDVAARLVDEACRELEIHAQLEEQLFYPAVRHEIADRKWIEEGEVEHETIAVLIEKLRTSAPGESRAVATATVLTELLLRHLSKEERRIFPQVRRASIDLIGLGELMRTRYADILSQRSVTTLPHPVRAGTYSGFAAF